MGLIDDFLPEFQFREIHSRRIRAAAAPVMAAVAGYRPESDPLFRAAIALRELPLRLTRRRRPPFGLDDFTLLGREGDRELVYGLAGRFWQADYGLIAITDAAAWRDCVAGGAARLALGFRIAPSGTGGVELFTETRIICHDRRALRRLRPYWYLIRPVSGLIRRRILSAIARRAAG
ncbi:hypothetical protein [Pseudogemmobacter humi]|uniref:DUF2867 domain-containing protein n=1 Tax=Pseudogemmobacter humi TaxID=2483812 RepID=A0A3P5XR76_9RHOB|nr:hypothetical protein [Pseudogemmobacter humi]VDC33393.1 hypothetical protein XINFAN_03806 [Pseudogemmobacter humi]